MIAQRVLSLFLIEIIKLSVTLRVLTESEIALFQIYDSFTIVRVLDSDHLTEFLKSCQKTYRKLKIQVSKSWT